MDPLWDVLPRNVVDNWIRAVEGASLPAENGCERHAQFHSIGRYRVWCIRVNGQLVVVTCVGSMAQTCLSGTNLHY